METEIMIMKFLIAIALVISAWALRYRRKLRQLQQQTHDIVGEEQRMFDFLHDLGEAIEKDTSQTRVHRMIVDGVVEVVGATGGALYVIPEMRQQLVPRYLTEHCPQLVGVPMEVMRRAQKDPRVLASHLRMANTEADEGILGHCLSVGGAVHISDVKSHASFRDAFVSYDVDVTAMLAPLRHGNKDLGVLAVAKTHDQGSFSEHDFTIFQSVAEQSSYALGNAMVHLEAHEKRSLENELRTAREVQRVLLPQEAPRLQGYRAVGTNLPARIISGDYYDYIPLDDHRWGVVIADVSGKGVAAGLLMAMCRSVLRAVAKNEISPAKTLAAVNRQLFPDIREDMFISMAYLILDGADGRAVIARAGHDPTFWYHKATGQVTMLKPAGLAVGLDSGDAFERVTVDYEFTLEPGDCLLLHTDGVKEAQNANEDEFGMARMNEAFRSAAEMGAESVLLSVQSALKQFTGDAAQMDDITLVALEKR